MQSKISLFFFGIKMRLYLFWQATYSLFLYRSNWRFVKADLLLSAFYLFQNPYSICRSYLENRGLEDIHVYGETPLYAFEAACKKFQISKNQVFYELGSGRGKLCFWASSYFGFDRVVGIEENPIFFSKAEKLRALLCIDNMSFVCQDILRIDYEKADIIYLYSTSMSDNFLKQLLKAFQKLKPGAIVISVSEPLKSELFELQDKLLAQFPWGKTHLFCNKKSS